MNISTGLLDRWKSSCITFRTKWTWETITK